MDGNTNGDLGEYCISTQCEAQPWWEIDLGDYCIVEVSMKCGVQSRELMWDLQTIKLWNRNDEPHDAAFERDLYRNRLFPCYLMLGGDPFPKDAMDVGDEGVGGKTNLQLALDKSVTRMKLTKVQRCSTWHVPANTLAR